VPSKPTVIVIFHRGTGGADGGDAAAGVVLLLGVFGRR